MVFNFKQFMFDKSLRQSDLAQILGESQSVISYFVNGKRAPMDRHLNMLEKEFGSDVISQYLIDTDKYREIVGQSVPATIIPAEVVEEIVEKAKEEAKEELVASVSVPIVSEEVTVTSNIDLEAYLEDYGDELEKFNVAAILEPVQVAERIKSSSMRSVLNNGDVVFLRFINADSMVSGKTYYFELKGLPRMLRIVKFEEDNKLRLKAANPKYDDIVIGREKVKKVAKIVCSMRFNFDDVDSELDDIRKKKDEQISTLIDAQIAQTSGFLNQMDKFYERESALIDIIQKKF